MSTQPPVNLDTTPWWQRMRKWSCRSIPLIVPRNRAPPVTLQHAASDTIERFEPSDAPAYGVPQVKPKEAPPGVPPIAGAGINLAKWVIVIVSGFMIAAVAVLVWSESKSLSLAETSYSQLSNPGTSTETATAVKELIDQIDAQRKAFREFWHEFAQMVLLNLLLPVLTAILGYVFGSREGK